MKIKFVNITELQFSWPDWYAHDSCFDNCFSEIVIMTHWFICDSHVIDKIRPISNVHYISAPCTL